MLLIECDTAAAKPEWRFGVGRMNRDAVRLKHKGETVWEAASFREHKPEDPYLFFGLGLPRQGAEAVTDSRELADPEFFSRLESVELRARSVVEGFLHGLHRSPYIGFSVEFASHHEYVPGDDPRHINWKLYARQHRLYVKEFDGDTNLNLYVLLDVSGSMACASLGRSKLHYSATLAAALAHLAIRQHDAAGVTLFADSVVASLPPRAKTHQLQEILGLIAERRPAGPDGRRPGDPPGGRVVPQARPGRGDLRLLRRDPADHGRPRPPAVPEARGGAVPGARPVGARPAAGRQRAVPRPGDGRDADDAERGRPRRLPRRRSGSG